MNLIAIHFEILEIADWCPSGNQLGAWLLLHYLKKSLAASGASKPFAWLGQLNCCSFVFEVEHCEPALRAAKDALEETSLLHCVEIGWLAPGEWRIFYSRREP